jgi:hypothetical protein
MDLTQTNPYMASTAERSGSTTHRVPESAEPGSMVETMCGVERYVRVLFRRDPESVSNRCPECFDTTK